MYSCNITGRSSTLSRESASLRLSTVNPLTPWRRANSPEESGFKKAPRNKLSGAACNEAARSINCVRGRGTPVSSQSLANFHLSISVSTTSAGDVLVKKRSENEEGSCATARAQSSEQGTKTAFETPHV